MGLHDSSARVRQEAERKLKKISATDKAWLKAWQDETKPLHERLMIFIEGLPVTKGIREGNTIDLLPLQRKFIEDVYRQHKDRRVRIGVLSAPRGNGKTGFIAGLALAHLLGPAAEPRGEVYSAAIDRQQASLIFAEMVAVILAVPAFASRVNVQRFHKKLEVLEGVGAGSIYEALSSDSRRAHGLSPTMWAYDEFAQSKDRELFDNLQTAMGKRKRSLGIVISTQAPTDDHPLSQLIDDGLSGNDPSIKVRLLAAPMGAPPFSVKTIRSVNPAFGKFLLEDDVMAEADRARRIAAFEPAFRNLRLNQRVEADTEHRLIGPDVWKLGNVPMPPLEDFAGRECFVGLDLSAKHDLTAMVLAFPDGNSKDPSFDILLYAWTPLEAMDRRRPTEQEIFRQWLASGYLIGVPGPVVRYGFVAHELARVSQDYIVRQVAYDRWRIDDLRQELDAIGVMTGDIPLMEFGQGFASMGPAVEWFAELAKAGRLRHGGNPVLQAAVLNSITSIDPAGNMKFDKNKSAKIGSVRIDPAVAMVMALMAAKRVAPVVDVSCMIG
jgi:phage terminase large subunit-like protein